MPNDRAEIADQQSTFASIIPSKLWNVWTAVGLLLAIHAGLLAYSATRHSPTLNEPGHLVAGLVIWRFDRYEVYRVNPPLVKMIAALPVTLAGYEEDWSSFDEYPGARPVFEMGADFISANGERSIWLMVIARWACIPISLAGGLFCFSWSRELWDSNFAGLTSLTLWCFEPNILAHGELITPDNAATSFGLGAGYLFWRWLKQPAWGRALAAGLLLGLAELSKMTWIILFALWPLLWIFWQLSRKRPAHVNNSTADADQLSILRQVAQLATLLLLAIYLLNLGYGFDGSFTRLQDFAFVSTTLSGLDESGNPGNRFIDTSLAELPTPFPKQYLLGLDVQKHDFEDYGQLSYLRGEWKNGGWWYYYLYGLTVKTPHGSQFLILIAIITIYCRRLGNVTGSNKLQVSATWRDLFVLLAPAITVLVLVSSQLEFNHHVRYVLPVVGFAVVFTGVVGDWFKTSSKAT